MSRARTRSTALVFCAALLAVYASADPAPALPLTDPQNLPGALEGNYLYRALMVRAAPGSLLALIDLYKAELPTYASISDAGPFLDETQPRRPVGSHGSCFRCGRFAEYYSPRCHRGARRAKPSPRRASREDRVRESDCSRRIASWQGGLVRMGAGSRGCSRQRFDGHVLLPRRDLPRARRTNAGRVARAATHGERLPGAHRSPAERYLHALQPEPPWDMFTLGFLPRHQAVR